VDGESEVIEGNWYVYRSAGVAGVTPADVRTLTSTVPVRTPNGTVTSHSPAVHGSRPNAWTDPKYTTPLDRFWPMTVTSSAPVSQPLSGSTAVIDGAPGRR
jgi:hypothetical protein